jgi:hypothetical protein
VDSEDGNGSALGRNRGGGEDAHPSVAQILRRRGFGYEAGRMDELVAAFDEVDKVSKEREEDGGANDRDAG